jgi:hypothetical protein
MLGAIKLLTIGGLLGLFSAVPTSTNYTLKSYDFGTGGGSASSTTYSLNGVSGTQTGSAQTSTTYANDSSLVPTQNANVPPAPALSNPSNYYNQLKLIVATGSNPTDAKYLIAISSDGFATTKYVQTDNSIGTSLSISNYQTYASWRGASGFLILGLNPSTTYQVKLKAMQGNFSESAFGPTASAATVATSLSFSVATTLTATPPFPVGFSSLSAGSVFSGDADASLTISSNATSGGAVYIVSKNGALTSSLAGSSIASASADLSAVAKGYGAQVIATGQTSGGPLASQAPFNGASNNVGALTTALQNILSSSAPITNGTATVRLKAKSDAVTPSSTDYSDTVTFVAAMIF